MLDAKTSAAVMARSGDGSYWASVPQPCLLPVLINGAGRRHDGGAIALHYHVAGIIRWRSRGRRFAYAQSSRHRPGPGERPQSANECRAQHKEASCGQGDGQKCESIEMGSTAAQHPPLSEKILRSYPREDHAQAIADNSFGTMPCHPFAAHL